MTQIRADTAIKPPLAVITVITGNATGSSPTKVDFSVLSGATLVAGYIADSESSPFPKAPSHRFP